MALKKLKSFALKATFRVIGEAQILCFAVLYTGGSNGPTRDQVKLEAVLWMRVDIVSAMSSISAFSTDIQKNSNSTQFILGLWNR